MVGVFKYVFTWVGVVGVLPRRGWNTLRGGALVVLFVVGLDSVDNDLGVGYYVVCGRVTDAGKVRLVLDPGLKADRGFKGLWYRFGLFLYRMSSIFSKCQCVFGSSCL